MNFALAGAYKNLVIMRDLDGVPPSEAQQDLVSNAAIAACDVVGGQHLGYIMDNAACRYDPRTDKAVLCTSDGASNSTPDCVSRKQATTMLKWWYGPTTDGSVPDPLVDNGVAAKLGGKHLWYGYMRDPSLAGTNFENAKARSEGSYLDWSYARFAKAYERAKALDAALGGVATDNPDLSAFKARGGKLVNWVEKGIARGRVDMATPPSTSVTITQPVCPHPQRAVYVSGDVKVAASYICK